MTKQEVVDHWRKGATDSLEVAQLCLKAKKYEQALFHCHLAVEKALKSAFIERHGEDFPYIHDLYRLALLVRDAWTEEQQRFFAELTTFAVESRYAGPSWTSTHATEQQAAYWTKAVELFLHDFLP